MKITAIIVVSAVGAVFIAAFAWKPPADSSDVAGWVQAFGATLAIGLAVYLQWHSQNEKRRQAEKMARTLVNQVLLSVDNLQSSARNQIWLDWQSCRQLLMTASAIQVDIAELNDLQTAMVLRVKDLAYKCYSDTDGHIENGNWQHHDNLVGNCGTDVRNAIAAGGLRSAAKSFSP